MALCIYCGRDAGDADEHEACFQASAGEALLEAEELEQAEAELEVAPALEAP